MIQAKIDLCLPVICSLGDVTASATLLAQKAQTFQDLSALCGRNSVLQQCALMIASYNWSVGGQRGD